MATRSVWIRKPGPLAPEQFPEVRKVGTTATFDFAPDGEGTRVTLTQSGWKQGKEWDDAYEYLSHGNAQLLEVLAALRACRWDRKSAAQKLGLDPGLYKVLRNPEKQIIVSVPIIRDSGELEVYTGYRVLFNTSRGWS